MSTLREQLDAKIAADAATISAATEDLNKLNAEKSALDVSGVLDVFTAEMPSWFPALASIYGQFTPNA